MTFFWFCFSTIQHMKTKISGKIQKSDIRNDGQTVFVTKWCCVIQLQTFESIVSFLKIVSVRQYMKTTGNGSHTCRLYTKKNTYTVAKFERVFNQI